MDQRRGIHYADDAVTPMHLGRIVRKLRKDAGLTQAELASKARVTRWWVSAVENGKTTVELGKVMVLLHHLGHKMAVLPVGTAGKIVRTGPGGELLE